MGMVCFGPFGLCALHCSRALHHRIFPKQPDIKRQELSFADHGPGAAKAY